MISRHVNPADKREGIIGYNSSVMRCYCSKLTNLVYRSYHGHQMIVCSQECADKNSRSALWKNK